MRGRTAPLHAWAAADVLGGHVQLDCYHVDGALSRLTGDARRVTVSAAAPNAENVRELERWCIDAPPKPLSRIAQRLPATPMDYYDEIERF